MYKYFKVIFPEGNDCRYYRYGYNIITSRFEYYNPISETWGNAYMDSEEEILNYEKGFYPKRKDDFDMVEIDESVFKKELLVTKLSK